MTRRKDAVLAVCVSVGAYRLTKGKIYYIWSFEDGYYCKFKDDCGEINGAHLDRFVMVKDILKE